MPKPVLAIAADSFLPRWDGIARVIIELVPQLTQNFNVRLLVPDYLGDRPQWDDVTYHLFPLLPILRIEGAGLPLVSSAVIDRALDGVDLLWTHTMGPIGSKAARIASKRSIPVVSMIHSIEWDIYAQNLPFAQARFRKFWLNTCRQRYNKAQQILTPSQATKEILEALQFIPPITVTPLGIDTDRFQPLTRLGRNRRRQALNIPKDSFVFGYLGRFGAEKNLKVLLDAFTQLGAPKTHLLMVGGNRSVLRDKEHTARTTWIPSTMTPEDYYPVMDAYVLPSLSECAPLAIREAMASGVIPLSTPVGNVPSYLTPDIGTLFTPNSVADLKSKMLELLNDPNSHEQRKLKARKLVMDRFNWTASSQRIVTIFDEILQRRVTQDD